MAAASASLTAVILLAFVLAAAAAAAVDDVCNSLGGSNVTPELCTSVLCADPSEPCRAAGNPAAVAALAARLASQNATVTKGLLETALSSRPVREGVVTEAIRSCLHLYAGVAPALQWAVEAAAAGQYRSAREVLKAAEYVAEGCQGLGAGGALPGANSAFVYVVRVGQAVLASMIRG